MGKLRGDYLALSQLCFRPGTARNHDRQILLYNQFCKSHKLTAIQPATSTLCYYITYLSQQFTSSDSVRNYVSGVSYFHKCLGKPFKALHQFPVVCLLRAIQVAMRRQPDQKWPITPSLLSKLVQLTKSLGPLGPPMKVALLFAFFGMLRVSNLAPVSPAALDSSRDMCRGDVVFKPPGLVLSLKWSKTLQTLGSTPLVPLPAMPGHHLDPRQAYLDLLRLSPTLSRDQPLLMFVRQGVNNVLTSPLLNKLLSDLLNKLGLDSSKFSFHSLRRGGATTAYHGGVKISEVKRHGVWASDSFWQYVTQANVSLSPVAKALALASSSV